MSKAKKVAAPAAPKNPRFSTATIKFLNTSYKQKSPLWLDKHRSEYENHVLFPLQSLARYLKQELAPFAPGYHFPQKGIGRVKCTAGTEPSEWTAGLYRCWLHYSAAVPRTLRFEHNPNLYFMIDATEKPSDRVLVAGGLYMPSSRQMRALRQAISDDASAFEKLFADRAFKKSFKGGFSLERSSSRVPKGFDPNHKHIDWIKLQSFFVWRPYKMGEFTSPKFPSIVAKDFRQILRLNELLTQAIQGRLPRNVLKTKSRETALLDRLSGLGENSSSVEPPRKMDF